MVCRAYAQQHLANMEAQPRPFIKEDDDFLQLEFKLNDRERKSCNKNLPIFRMVTLLSLALLVTTFGAVRWGEGLLALIIVPAMILKLMQAVYRQWAERYSYASTPGQKMKWSSLDECMRGRRTRCVPPSPTYTATGPVFGVWWRRTWRWAST